MRLSIIAIGRLKDGGERVLVDRYRERLSGARTIGLGPMSEKELAESRLGSASERMAEEASRLLRAAETSDLKVALSEEGKQLSSEAFARFIGQKRDAGVRQAAFLIGGADGHGKAVLAAAQVVLSLGPMTLPHGMARAVLAEQLYRASTILAGHPYHRA
ncbi:MAG: 23S rRNA (pseudouridine(1915)-N(3))-methyltransferase RlmH [Proteobacteria bacterium]|nr:23S rRNA (pseudouridine(1915)-N(3))-methyltransferase RlmH [Pseudomonadota bacterium]